MRTVTSCRSCGGSSLEEFLDLGEQPHCNAFLRADQLDGPEPRWPLALLFCHDCQLVQLSTVVDPALMFRDYVYVSGTTSTLRQHFEESSRRLVDRHGLNEGDLVVDIGSNDGTFLNAFGELGMRTVGVDPARNVAETANARGIETIPEFFTAEVARGIRADKGEAALVTACGVFFHIDDMDEVCAGILELIGEKGVLQVQAIYLGAMLEQGSYDNVYHEHVSYYTLHSLRELLARRGLEIFSVDLSPIHGGSLVVHAGRPGQHVIDASVTDMAAREIEQGLTELAPYREWADRVRRSRESLLALLVERKEQGRRIAAYSAPAKGNTLLNYCGIGPELLDYAVEKAPLKIGLYTPGTHLPVLDEGALTDPPDDYLLLAWNFRDELIDKNHEFREAGGRFIVPIPEPAVV